MNKLCDRLREEGKEMVIFHCHYSKIRGPTTAMAFHSFTTTGNMECKGLEIKVLKGGIAAWVRLYQDDQNLCEKIK